MDSAGTIIYIRKKGNAVAEPIDISKLTIEKVEGDGTIKLVPITKADLKVGLKVRMASTEFEPLTEEEITLSYSEDKVYRTTKENFDKTKTILKFFIIFKRLMSSISSLS